MKWSFLLTTLLSLIIPAALFSQAYKIGDIKDDSSGYEGKRLIQDIRVIGNKITKEYIILRELTFDVGDSLSNLELKKNLLQSKKNILNTSLFNFVQFDWAVDPANDISIVISLTERWYFWPSPIFEIDDINFNTWWKTKDFSRINYGLYLSLKNFRGRKETLKTTLQLGYSQEINFSYTIPYIDRKKKSGLGFAYSYSRQHEISYLTDNNKRLFYKHEEKFSQKQIGYGISYFYRNRIFDRHTLSVNYHNISVLDTVVEINPNYLGNGKSKSEFFSLNYNFVHDERDSKNYPLKGNYLSLNLRKYGVGILSSSLDLWNLSVTYKKFWQLGERFFLAGRASGVLAANNEQPYLLQNGLGYSEGSAVRSYEYYVVDGQNVGLAKVQFKYQLIKPASAKLPLIPFEKFNRFHYAFYLGIFSDVGFVDDNTGYPHNKLANMLLYGNGIGLDFVTYYDMVLRTEYSFNRFGESGIFLHFIAPI